MKRLLNWLRRKRRKETLVFPWHDSLVMHWPHDPEWDLKYIGVKFSEVSADCYTDMINHLVQDSGIFIFNPANIITDTVNESLPVKQWEDTQDVD